MSVVAPFPPPWDRRPIATFDRKEWTRILDLYGRMVAAGHWRDYALRIDPDLAVFAAYRRTSERPEIRIEKRPALRLKQGRLHSSANMARYSSGAMSWAASSPHLSAGLCGWLGSDRLAVDNRQPLAEAFG